MDWWAGINSYGAGPANDISHIDSGIFDPWIQCEDIEIGTILHQAGGQSAIATAPSSTSTATITTASTSTSNSSSPPNLAPQSNSLTAFGYPQISATNGSCSAAIDTSTINHNCQMHQQQHQLQTASSSSDDHITPLQAQYLYTSQVADATIITMQGPRQEPQHLDQHLSGANGSNYRGHQQQHCNSFTTTKQDLFNIITTAAVDVISSSQNNHIHESHNTSISSQCSSSLSSSASSNLSSVESSPLNNQTNYLSSPSPIMQSSVAHSSLSVDVKPDESSSSNYTQQKTSSKFDSSRAELRQHHQTFRKEISREQSADTNNCSNQPCSSDKCPNFVDRKHCHIHLTASGNSGKIDTKKNLQLQVSIAAISSSETTNDNTGKEAGLSISGVRDTSRVMFPHSRAPTHPAGPLSAKAASVTRSGLSSDSSLMEHSQALGINSEFTKAGTMSVTSSGNSFILPHSSNDQQPRITNQQPAQKVRRCRHITDYVLADEEKRLLIKEGYTDFPMTCQSRALSKSEERILRKIRRKIRNKKSAQCSRQRKKEYVEDLEKKYATVVRENEELKLKIDRLHNQQQVRFQPEHQPSSQTDDVNLVALDWKDLFVSSKGSVQIANVFN